jgi:hypothetical protein
MYRTNVLVPILLGLLFWLAACAGSSTEIDNTGPGFLDVSAYTCPADAIRVEDCDIPVVNGEVEVGVFQRVYTQFRGATYLWARLSWPESDAGCQDDICTAQRTFGVYDPAEISVENVIFIISIPVRVELYLGLQDVNGQLLADTTLIYQVTGTLPSPDEASIGR